ncbi:hypothetical protein C0J52_09265 [Blattella germanica]|nr:hypothetical protein C0J52_09265 [Blattella germanica]
MPQQKMMAKTSRIVALCSIANFINAADRVIMPIAIVPMTDEFKWSLHWQGWILSAFAFGYFTSQVIGACAASRFGGKAVLLFAVFLWSVSTSVTPLLATSVPALIFCRVLLGLGEGLGLPTIFHIFAHNVPMEERSRAFGYLVAAGFVHICPGKHAFIYLERWVLFGFSSGYYSTMMVTNPNVRWTEFVCHWPLWALYIAHFAMNWSNYIIMQWLPTYLARNLGANKESISLTAVPYIVNSLESSYLHFALLTTSWLQLFVSISMGLCACNSAGHLSNHADIAPNHAGITFAISNTLATIPGILCGPLTAELVTTSHGRWFPVFVLAAGVNFTGAVIYYSQSSAAQVL